MFLHDFTYVDQPSGLVRHRLLAQGGAVLSRLADEAAREGDEIRLRVGPIGALPVLGKTVEVVLGKPYERGDVAVVPFSWRAEGRYPGVFPVLEGDLEIAGLGPGRTQLSLLARYEPPLGGVGRRLDQFLLHRIAEASVRAFLVRVAALLDASAGVQDVAVGTNGPAAA